TDFLEKIRSFLPEMNPFVFIYTAAASAYESDKYSTLQMILNLEAGRKHVETLKLNFLLEDAAHIKNALKENGISLEENDDVSLLPFSEGRTLPFPLFPAQEKLLDNLELMYEDHVFIALRVLTENFSKLLEEKWEPFYQTVSLAPPQSAGFRDVLEKMDHLFHCVQQESGRLRLAFDADAASLALPEESKLSSAPDLYQPPPPAPLQPAL
ncbi:MAG: hypothetical protein V1746_01365, partial [bacterium]